MIHPLSQQPCVINHERHQQLPQRKQRDTSDLCLPDFTEGEPETPRRQRKHQRREESQRGWGGGQGSELQALIWTAVR